MTEKEIEESKKALLSRLKKDELFYKNYDDIYYIGDLDNYQIWDPDFSEMELIMNPEYLKVDPRDLSYEWVCYDDYFRLSDILEKKYPKYFSPESKAKRNYKKDLRLKQLSEEIDKILLGVEEE